MKYHDSYKFRDLVIPNALDPTMIVYYTHADAIVTSLEAEVLYNLLIRRYESVTYFSVVCCLEAP